MFSIELVFDRPTKRTVRFAHQDFGTLYVPNAVYEQLGQPEAIRMTLDANAAAVELAQVA